MERLRIFCLILLFPAFVAALQAQEKAATAKGETEKSDAARIDQLLQSQTAELQKLREEVAAQADKIDKLSQQVTSLSEEIKPKATPAVARAEPVTPATPSPATPEPTTAGTDKPVADNSAVKTHVVAKGETLTQISKQYGVSVEDIEQLNKIGDAKKLQAGQTIKIPAGSQGGPTPTATPAQ